MIDNVTNAVLEIVTGFPTRIRINYEGINKFRKIFRNYFEIYMSHIKNNFPVNGILRDGNVVKIESPAHLMTMLLDLRYLRYDELTDITEFEADGTMIRLAGLNYGGDLGVFTGTYNIDVKNRIVLDIGANIGDSAVHFINSGASSVIAVEADPFTFDLLRKNVEINSLDKKVILINAAISSKSGILRIPYRKANVIGTAANLLRYPDGSEGVEVKQMTLGSLIEEYQVSAAVMKMDCEGCEYSAFLDTEDSRVTNAFNEIAIEYHYGSEKLRKYFEKNGYKVEVTPEKKYYNKGTIPHIMHLGTMYARK